MTVHVVTDETEAIREGYVYEPFGGVTVVKPGSSGEVEWSTSDVMDENGSSSIENPLHYTACRIDAVISRNRSTVGSGGALTVKGAATAGNAALFAILTANPTAITVVLSASVVTAAVSCMDDYQISDQECALSAGVVGIAGFVGPGVAASTQTVTSKGMALTLGERGLVGASPSAGFGVAMCGF